MIFDARSVPNKTTLDADICIAGAGVAGITLARELINAGVRVCLLESGGLEPDRVTQSLYWGENIGLPYYSPDVSQARFFGGTSNCWHVGAGSSCACSPRVRSSTTEMVVANAVLRGDRRRLLGFDPAEHPVALQLGGSDPAMLAEAASIGEQCGYDEVNLNVGCPSDRVQSATFGACLMASPRLVAECVRAMRAAVRIPVTVKTRIGIDDRDDYGFLRDFVDDVAGAGCEVFIIHARKAILKGLSPKENREIPPMDYARAWQLKHDCPRLTVMLERRRMRFQVAA